MTGMMAIDGIWWREMDPIGVMDWINHIRLYQCMVFQCSFRVANKQALTGDVGFSHWSHEKTHETPTALDHDAPVELQRSTSH